MVTRVLAGGNYLSRRHSASFAETRRYLERGTTLVSLFPSTNLTNPPFPIGRSKLSGTSGYIITVIVFGEPKSDNRAKP